LGSGTCAPGHPSRTFQPGASTPSADLEPGKLLFQVGHPARLALLLQGVQPGTQGGKDQLGMTGFVSAQLPTLIQLSSPPPGRGRWGSSLILCVHWSAEECRGREGQEPSCTQPPQRLPHPSWLRILHRAIGLLYKTSSPRPKNSVQIGEWLVGNQTPWEQLHSWGNEVLGKKSSAPVGYKPFYCQQHAGTGNQSPQWRGH
jgi:hypothetical protein